MPISAEATMPSVSSYVLRMAKYKDQTAFIEQGVYRSHAYSYGQVVERALAFSEWVRRRQLAANPGSEAPRVVLWAIPGARWAMAFYGCILAGATVVPVDAGFSPEYLGRISGGSGASLLITDRSDRGDSGFAQAGELEQFLIQDIDGIPAATEEPGQGVAVNHDTLAEIVYTSGTTAEPRGVMITHGNLLANLVPIEREIRRYEKFSIPFRPIRFVHLIPLSHLFGQVTALFIPQLLRGVVIFPESQSPAMLARTIKDRRASVMVSVPQQLEAMSNWAKGRLVEDGYGDPDAATGQAGNEGWSIPRRWWKFRHLHRRLGWKMWAFVVGGAVLPTELEQLWNRLGYAVIQGYGLTETAPAITITHPFRIRRGAVGKPLPGVETHIADDGEILVRGANVSPGYYRDAESTRESFEDGWLHTGDLGRFDEDGNLLYLGRKKEVIVTAEGLNVYPGDVEKALRDQAEVQDAAVVGKETGAGDSGGGRTVVHAALVPKPGASMSDLEVAVQKANVTLESHQRVRGFSVWPDGSLPRTLSTSKLQRGAVARWVNSGGGETMPRDARAGQTQDWRYFLTRLGTPIERVQPESRLAEDLGLSSLDRLELLTWLETRGYSFDEQELARAQTVGDIEKLLETPSATAAARTIIPAAERHGGLAQFQQSYGTPDPVPRVACRAEPRWPLSRAAAVGREAIQKLLAFPLLRWYVKTEVHGSEKLRQLTGPVLFVSNHQSLIDPPVILRSLPARIRRRVAPAMGEAALRGHSKATLFWARLGFNVYLISDDPGRAQEALRHAGRLADRGYSSLLFPEGERTWDGRLLPFRPGVGVMAERLRLPVVPLLIQGLFEIWPRTQRRPLRGKAHLWIGDLIKIMPRESAGDFTRRLEQYYRTWRP
ncbi:MAG TPA: AMP-binding protein [Terriglobia bacterium]|nr:AMP-binding protein [Terriglobia bacterium]